MTDSHKMRESVEEKRRRMLRTDAIDPDDEERFVFGGRRFSVVEIARILRPLVTDDRAARIEEVLARRTRTVVPVIEGLVNMGNVSAVMRSAEALGYQDFHVITGGESFKDSQRTSQGAEKWLDVYGWRSPAECAAYLRADGYRILTTHLSTEARPIDAFDFTEKTALVFGNERDGVSEEMLRHSDETIILPIEGFAQSYNISVAAAIALYHAYRDRLSRHGTHGDLTPAEIAELRAHFYLRSVRRAERVLAKEAEDDV